MTLTPMAEILIVLVVLGALYYVIGLIPGPTLFRNIAYLVITVFALIWAIRLIAASGVLPF